MIVVKIVTAPFLVCNLQETMRRSVHLTSTCASIRYVLRDTEGLIHS